MIWEEYGRVRDYNNSQIKILKDSANNEHQEMKECFEEARRAYHDGNKSEAAALSAEGRAHRDLRNEMNGEVARLIEELKEAKKNALENVTVLDSQGFDASRNKFQQAKNKHEELRLKFKEEKQKKRELREEIKFLQEEFKRLKQAFAERLAEVRKQDSKK